MLWTRIAILVHCSPYSKNIVVISKPGLQKKKLKMDMSLNIQNECLMIMSSHILSRDIQESGWFTIMADECTDAANKE